MHFLIKNCQRKHSLFQNLSPVPSSMCLLDGRVGLANFRNSRITMLLHYLLISTIAKQPSPIQLPIRGQSEGASAKLLFEQAPLLVRVNRGKHLLHCPFELHSAQPLVSLVEPHLKHCPFCSRVSPC